MKALNNLNVLLCSPSDNVIGGISKWTGHILNYHKNINSTITLNHFYAKGYPVYQSTPKFKRIILGIRSYLPFLFGLNRILNSQGYNVIHFTSSASVGLIRDYIVIKIAKKKGIATVIHFRFGRIPQLCKKKNWEYFLLRQVLKISDLALVIDNSSYGSLIKHGYKNIKLLPNPLTPHVNDIIANNRIDRIDGKILFVGHVVKTKGVIELVEACKKISNITLTFVGYVSDEMRHSIIMQAGTNHQNWLNIKGEMDYESTIREMLSCNVFVLPTYSEGFPNVIIESMACGCPIITTNVGAIPEMMDIYGKNNNGLVIEPKNIDQLTNAINRMLHDKEFAFICGENAQKRINDLYSMPKIWNQLEQLWHSVIK